MDLEIRTGLLESGKLNTLIEITVPRDVLLFWWGEGAVLVLPRLPIPSAPAHQSLGGVGSALPQPSAVLDYLTRRAMNIWENEPVWQNPLCSSTPLLNHALSVLKMCLELRNLKEGLIKGIGETTHSELLCFICLVFEAFRVFISPIFFLSWFDLL